MELRNFESSYTQSINSPEVKIKILIIVTFVFTHLRGWDVVPLALFSYYLPHLVREVEKVVSLTHETTTLTAQTLAGVAGLPPLQGELKEYRTIGD